MGSVCVSSGSIGVGKVSGCCSDGLVNICGYCSDGLGFVSGWY